MSTAAVVFLAAVLTALYALVVLLGEPGQNPLLVLWWRYGPTPFVAGVAALVFVAGVLVAPEATFTVAAVVAGVVTLAFGWGPRTWGRAGRRIALRARWTSVARSSELAVQRDHRVPGIGADSATLTEVVRLEHTPRIWRGRALAGGAGVRYQLQPARGSSVPEIAKQVERLAAGLHVAAVEIEQVRPDRAVMTVRWQ